MAESLARTVSSRLTEQLRHRILAGAYAPGSQLLQDAIAAEFGVSKIPVREALVQLQAEGLVDIFAHRGFQVRPLSASELEEAFRLRLQIEPPAVALGSRRATRVDREGAHAALERFNDALAANALEASHELNRAFHLALVVPRLHPVTADVLGRLHTLAQRHVQIHLTLSGRIARARREHTSLYRAWAHGQAKRASDLARGHIECSRNDLARLLERPKRFQGTGIA